ncbi:MAG: transposase [Acidobacteriia bacterium]|nr:transposase [Terriglobia bacterium]
METARALIRKSKREARRRFSAEEKVRTVLEGMRGEVAVAKLCCQDGIHLTAYYKWLKDFLEEDEARMLGDAVQGGHEGRGERTAAGR